MHKHFDKIKAKSLPDSESEITGELTVEFIEECRKQALKELNKRSNFAGFRPGHIPEEVLVKRLGEGAILEESAEIALGQEFPNIIKESGVSAIGRPTVTMTKMAPGIPLEFKITTAVEPVFELPDYRKLSKEAKSKEEKIEIKDEEVKAVLDEIKERGINPELKEGEDLTKKIKENITLEKEFRAKEKQRLQIIESLINATNVEVPKILIEAELDKMVGQFKDDVARAGLEWADYLKSINKKEEEVKDEWKPKALDRAKAELVVNKIAEKEKIEPSNEELEHETTHMLEHYPDADPLRVRIYLYTQMRNEKVFEFLESL
jgi:FKBP-type peptidyl-prolyl cis-trans isomerase (trigger factor)